MKNSKFTYPVLSIRAIDGDTFAVEIDRGFNDYSNKHVRVSGIDAPEVGTEAGRAVMRVAEQWCASATKSNSLMLDSTRLDEYGRVLGDLYIRMDTPTRAVKATPEERLSAYLLSNGLAKAMTGSKRPTWTAAELAAAKMKAEELLV